MPKQTVQTRLSKIPENSAVCVNNQQVLTWLDTAFSGGITVCEYQIEGNDWNYDSQKNDSIQSS